LKNNVKQIISDNLCTGCGTCINICPKDALKMTRLRNGFLVPKIDESICISCGLCVKVCPGKGLPKETTDVFEDIFHGINKCAYIGHANNTKLWENGQSGGGVSALLFYLFDGNLIDSAIVNKFDIHTRAPLTQEISTKEEIFQTQGSFYTQSAVNVKTIKKNSSKRTAAVVLGCQAQGIELTKKLSNKYGTPEFLIGLMCGGNNSNLLIDDLIKRSKLKKKKITSFLFRDKNLYGWPGDLSIKTHKKMYLIKNKDGTLQNNENVMEFMKIRDHYINYRCLHCFDQMNIFSDVVVGDPWGFEFENRKKGASVFIARTKKGQDLLEAAIKNNYLIAKPISIGEVYSGQTVDTRVKKRFTICKATAETYKLPKPHYSFDIKINPEQNNIKISKKYYKSALLYRYFLQKTNSVCFHQFIIKSLEIFKNIKKFFRLKK
jgi:coenzyme F420 hydrogenase subunit beta